MDMTNTDALREALFAMLDPEAGKRLREQRPDLPEKAVTDAGKINWKNLDVGIQHEGTKITLPADPAKMKEEDAIDALQRRIKDQNTEMAVHEIIDAFPLDGAVAFVRAMQVKYGWATSVPTPGFFGPKPPRMLTVDVGPGPDDKVQVPWGGFKIPGVENPIYTETTQTRHGPAFLIHGTVRKKDAQVVKDLADLTRKIVNLHSIYRGKAIRIMAGGSGEVDFNNPPSFIDVGGVSEEDLILPRLVEAQLRTNVWTLIEKTGECQKARIPLKRGILLEGKYGTGKTLASRLTGSKAVANGWTFITLDRVQGLKQTLEFAKRYEPCVIFAEDIDRAIEERNEAGNDLLNILDGVLSKNSKVMVVLTTNYVEKLDRAMLRPGRLDAVISVTPPDAEAVGRLINLYGRGLIKKGESLDKIGTLLAGSIPATIREVVERAKLAAIGAGREKIVEDDMVVVAEGMKRHMELLNGPQDRAPTAEEALGNAMSRILQEKVGELVLTSTAVQLKVAEMADGCSVDPGDVLGNREEVAQLAKRLIDSRIIPQQTVKDPSANTLPNGVAAAAH